MNLRPFEIDLWRIDLASEIDVAADLLSDAERARSAKFVRARDRARYVRAHVALRTILSAYGAGDASEIEIETGAEGKPFVGGSPIHFNLSHSGDCAVVALTLDGAIGVDIEERRERGDYMELARRFFSAAEICDLALESGAERPLAFLTCWTRKEALLKATGAGLQHLQHANVGIAPDAALVKSPMREAITHRIQTLPIESNAVVSIAGPVGASRLRCFTYLWAPHAAGANVRANDLCATLC